jgi:hypothetical protein
MIHMGDEDRKIVSSTAARDHHHHRTTQPTKRSPQKTPFTDTLHGKAPRLLRRPPFYPVPSLGSVFKRAGAPSSWGLLPSLAFGARRRFFLPSIFAWSRFPRARLPKRASFWSRQRSSAPRPRDALRRLPAAGRSALTDLTSRHFAVRSNERTPSLLHASTQSPAQQRRPRARRYPSDNFPPASSTPPFRRHRAAGPPQKEIITHDYPTP